MLEIGDHFLMVGGEVFGGVFGGFFYEFFVVFDFLFHVFIITLFSDIL